MLDDRCWMPPVRLTSMEVGGRRAVSAEVDRAFESCTAVEIFSSAALVCENRREDREEEKKREERDVS